jgi:hypothetical protein
LQDLVGALPGVDLGVGQEGNQASLEGAETAFDFAFGLRGWGDQMGDFQGSQSALKLALWIAVVAAGAGPEKTEGVSVDGVGNAVGLKGAAEVQEVAPGRVREREAARQIEAGMVIDREQENLFLGSGPPLVNGAVVLPEIADMGSAKTAIDARLARGSGDQVGKMDFDVGLDAGAGAFEVAEALELIADKLVVGRALQRQKALEEGVNFRRPGSVMVAAAGAGLEDFWINEPGGAKLIKAGFADSKEAGGGGGVLAARVEIRKDAQDEIGGQTANNLFLFKTEASIGGEDLRDTEIEGPGAGRGGLRIPGASVSASASLRPPPRPQGCVSQRKENQSKSKFHFCSVSVHF